MASPSEVHRIAREVLTTDDPRPSRRYVLMNDPRPVASIAYATRSENAIGRGSCVPVPPRPDGTDCNGLDELAHVFPGLLFPVTEHHLRRPLGCLNEEEWKKVRACAPAALGCGKGSSLSKSDRGLRGVVARFHQRITDTAPLLTLNVIVTPYPFSVHRDAYLAVIPLYIGARKAHAPGFLVEDTPWTRSLGDDVNRVAVAVADITMVKSANLCAGPPNAICDDSFMTRIDEALKVWLGLD